ncbi:SCO7613 C-terminal domain-containing membrane protein [Micromonospora sp. WMMD1219]|uniref:SCO7613 C-terminal domain-containing membrane protein n=1 Tax=Micromonospora sp. WMMD1219 TaxID=3404115 RepID=UPI003BF4866E
MENTGYPCPGCGAPADLVAGCRTCGRPPYPPAAEVVRLDREITELAPRVEAARLAYQDLSGRLVTARQRRAALAARIRQEIPAPRAAGPAPLPAPTPPRPVPVPPTPAVRPGGAETSTRAVQGLLFVLGGLLLGTAAVVFTAVAWATFGVAGRALILLAVTALALVAPLVARARGLRGTAETLASVALLLVVLDGYAAWSVDLFGVTGLPGSRYAALVTAVGAAVAAGYALVSRLTAPWFAAWLLAQPVLPLAAAAFRPTAAGWALVLTAVALGDLAVVVALRRRTSGSRTALVAGRVLGWTGHGVALVLAAGCALVPLALGRAAGTPLLAGGPLLVVALAVVAGALAAGGRLWRATAGGLLVPVLAVALVRPVGELRPGLLLLAAGLVVAALAGAVRALPAPVRTGPLVGALAVAAALGQVAVVLTGVVGAAAASAGFPAWQGGRDVPVPSWGWQLPVALLLTAGAVALLTPRAVRPLAGVAAAGLVALAVPAVTATPWPLVLVVDLAAATALLLAAVVRPRGGRVVVPAAASAGAVLLGHALLVGCAAPAGAVAVLAVTVVLGAALATLGRRGQGAQPVVGGVALAVALLAVPAGVAVALLGLGAPAWWQLRGATAAVVVPVVVVLAVRRLWTDLSGYASTGLAVALAGVGLGPLVAPGGEPVALYAAVGVLLALAAGAGSRPAAAPRAVGAALAGLALLAGAWTALLVLANLPVRPGAGVPAAATASAETARAGLVLLLLGAAAGAYAATDRRVAWWLAASPFGAVALPVLAEAAGAPWPVVPAVAFGIGLAALLAAALTGAHRAVLVPLGVVLAVPGFGGLLATRAATLAALGVLVVAGAVTGVAGRPAVVRIVGWLGAVTAATGFAVVASLTAGQPLRTGAFAVLAVAAVTLHAAPLLRLVRSGGPDGAGAGRAGAWALEASAQAVALLALLLAGGSLRHAAAVCVLWGVAVAVRVLRRGESPAGRRALAAVAAGSELVGGWLVLAARGVVVLEAYTLPAAALALGAGVLALRHRPGLTSWLALGPGLGAALLPSLVSVLVLGEPQPWRRLALGAAAVAVVFAGAARRWQAPVVLGAATLVPLALHELARGWDLLPRWIFLGLGGLLLIGLAATYERRRRDVVRLRDAVARLG